MKAQQIFTIIAIFYAFFCNAYNSFAASKERNELQIKAESGDTEAQKEFAALQIRNGNDADAFKWFRKAANQGDAEAQYEVGLCYANGIGVVQDCVESVIWFRKSAEQGDAEAQVALGSCYMRGEGVVRDFNEAMKWYQKAAKQDVAFAKYWIGFFYENGLGVEANITEAIKWYVQAEHQGLDLAQYSLGLCYLNGDGVARDIEKAFSLLLKAAEQGFVNAQSLVGAAYYTGRDGIVEQNLVEAEKWFRKAAERGEAVAQFRLAMMYFHGVGVAVNYEESVKWFERAAKENNVPKAQLMLGICYAGHFGFSSGFGSDCTKEALYWYRQAANNGDIDAKRFLGEKITSEDVLEEEAEPPEDKCYYTAAELGCADAQCMLGLCYLAQEGFNSTEETANKWLRKAAEQGNKRAKQAIGENECIVVDKFQDYIALITAGNSTGTGFLCSIDGKKYMITNEHVMRGGKPFKAIMLNGKQLKFKNQEIATDRDLIRCELVEDLPTLSIGGAIPNLGDEIAVYGNSGGKMVVTELKGTVVGIGIKEIEVDAGFIGGNSGSPIIDSNNRVIAVATFAQMSTAASDWVKTGTRFDGVRRFGLRLDGIKWKKNDWKKYCSLGRTLRDTDLILSMFYDDKIITQEISQSIAFADWPHLNKKIKAIVDADQILTKDRRTFENIEADVRSYPYITEKRIISRAGEIGRARYGTVERPATESEILTEINNRQRKAIIKLQKDFAESAKIRKEFLDALVAVVGQKMWPNESIWREAKQYLEMAKVMRKDFDFMRKEAEAIRK